MFNIFVNNLDVGIEYTPSKFADDEKLGGVTDTCEVHAVNQRDLESLEVCTDNNLQLLKQ